MFAVGYGTGRGVAIDPAHDRVAELRLPLEEIFDRLALWFVPTTTMRRLILPDRRQRLKTDRTIQRSIPTATKTAAPTLKYQARSTCTRQEHARQGEEVVPRTTPMTSRRISSTPR